MNFFLPILQPLCSPLCETIPPTLPPNAPRLLLPLRFPLPPLRTHHLTTFASPLPHPIRTSKIPPFLLPTSGFPSDPPFSDSVDETRRWNSILRTHFESGSPEVALSAFAEMRACGVRPDHYTFPLVNRVVGSCGDAGVGETVHGLGIRMGFGTDLYFCNTMLEVYIKCCCFEFAQRLFDEMPERDVVSWTSLMSGHGEIGMVRECFGMFGRMRMDGIEPNSVTFVVALRACCGIEKQSSFVAGQLFGLSIKNGFWTVDSVQNAVLTVFWRMGCIDEAVKIFDRIQQKSAISWNIMISIYASSGNFDNVIECFHKMQKEENPTHETLSLVLAAFSGAEDHFQGQKMHSHALKSGLIDNILQASLVGFYSKCRKLEAAVELFEEADKVTCISWSVMMSGFVSNGCFVEAVNLFRRMQSGGIDPDSNTLKEMLAACIHLGAFQPGKEIHGYSIRHQSFGILDNGHLETSLVNMYAKCGSILHARRCFDHMAFKDIVAWSAIIEAYVVHGIASEALILFHQMHAKGIKPNAITFLSLLSVCSHTGLIHEACDFFMSMTQIHGIRPSLDHYTCLVDLLGRHGWFKDVANLIHIMDVEPDSGVWGSLLASSVAHSNGESGMYAAGKVLELEPENVGYRVLLSNLYASSEKWWEVNNLRNFIREKRLTGTPAWSFIVVNGKIHMFTAGDRSHSQKAEICDILGTLCRKTDIAP